MAEAREFQRCALIIGVLSTLESQHDRLIAVLEDNFGPVDMHSPVLDFSFTDYYDDEMGGRPVRYLNELEYIDGKVWANVYTTDLIVIINPATGVVEATVDCTGLLPASLRDRRTDVLNGIAFDPVSRKTYLTGKYWKRLYEIELVEKK